VLALLASGILEELIFRGLLQSTVLAAFGRWGLLYGAMLFAGLHVGYLSWQHLLFALVLGLFFAYAAYHSASLLGVALAHAIANVVAQQAMPTLAQRAPAQVPVVVQATLAALLLASLSMLVLLGWRVRQRGQTTRRPAVRPSLRDVRRQAGLRHTELALRTGIPARTLAEVEFGITIFTEEQRQRIGEVFGLRIPRFAEEPGR
jgi:hypothetical protein